MVAGITDLVQAPPSDSAPPCGRPARTHATGDAGPDTDSHTWWAGSVIRSIRAHKVPIVVTVLCLVTGMAFMFLWDPLVYHRQEWALGGDGWGIWRAAHYVGWGYLGGVYTPGTGVVSVPGMEVILAPFAVVSGHFGLTESAGLYILAHPTAALVMQPVEILLASTAVFAADALARRMGVGASRRTVLCLVVGLMAWAPAVLWGHAEDPLAVAIAIYALLAALDRRWVLCGWLFGAAIAVQPLVGLLLPLLVAVSPPGQRVRTVLRSLLLSAFLVAVAFLGNASDTYRSIVQQPTPPTTNHATPWVSLAPVVDRVSVHAHQSGTALVKVFGTFAFRTVTVHGTGAVEVSGGPGRFVYLGLAAAAGAYVWRRPQSGIRLLWIAALVLASRCLFEPVMTPYYLAPPFILALAVAARSSARRFGAGCAVAVLTSVFAYFRFAPWEWWLPVVGGTVAVVVLAFPTRRAVSASTVPPADGLRIGGPPDRDDHTPGQLAGS